MNSLGTSRASPTWGSQRVSPAVPGLACGMVVNGSVQLDGDPQLRTIEICDEAVEHVLPAELEAEALSVPKQSPRLSLCPGLPSPELPRPPNPASAHPPRMSPPTIIPRRKTTQR